MEGNGGSTGTQGGEEVTVISSTPSDDVDVQEGQDDETIPGSGTHLDGVVVKVRTKVKHRIVSIKVTVYGSVRRILGLVKTDRTTKKLFIMKG